MNNKLINALVTVFSHRNRTEYYKDNNKNKKILINNIHNKQKNRLIRTKRKKQNANPS